MAPRKQDPPRWVPPAGGSLPDPPACGTHLASMTLAFHTSVTSKTVLDVIFFKLKLVLIDAIRHFFRDFLVFSKTIMTEMVEKPIFTSKTQKIQKKITEINLVHFGAPALQKCLFRKLSSRTLINFPAYENCSGRLILWTLTRIGGCWLAPGR